MSLAIDCQSLQFSYKDDVPIVNLEALQVERGERLFIYGPSGSGKTTLLGLIAGILCPQRGQLRVLGNDLSKMGRRARDRYRGAHMGYIFQQFNLIPYLNVLDNITLPCQMSAERRRRLGHVGMEAKAQELADHLDIGQFLKNSVLQLSVGQQQRVAAARALMGSPECVIADEPTSALDADRRTNFLQVLFREAEIVNSTVIFVSHDRSLAHQFDRQINLLEINQVRGGEA